MFTTLALVRQRLAALRAALDELDDLAAQAETTGALLPLEAQSRLLLDLDGIAERLEQVGEEVGGAVDPRLARRDPPEAPAGEDS